MCFKECYNSFCAITVQNGPLITYEKGKRFLGFRKLRQSQQKHRNTEMLFEGTKLVGIHKESRIGIERQRLSSSSLLLTPWLRARSQKLLGAGLPSSTSNLLTSMWSKNRIVPKADRGPWTNQLGL